MGSLQTINQNELLFESEVTLQIENIIDGYAACWTEMSSVDRLTKLRMLLTTDVFYHDPAIQVSGVIDFEIHISKVVKKRPGAIVLRTTKIDMHHNTARFGWNLVLPDGTKLPESIDVVRLNTEKNLLSGILGFFGPLKRL